MRLSTKDFVTSEAVTLPGVKGICAGTSILTLKGEMSVDQISVGDRVITRDSGATAVKSIKTTTVQVAPIRIKAGSLGHTRPDRDMIVAPNTQLYIRDWRAEALFGKRSAAIEAIRLIDGEFLAQEETVEMTVYTLILDREHIIYADGVEMITGA
ncbi:MAG: Hint domain-containing protein [Pseudomonadota bacterium]